jgi:hypothetical protein
MVPLPHRMKLRCFGFAVLYRHHSCGHYYSNGFYVREDQIRGRFSAPYSPERFYNPLLYDKVVSFPKRAG